jgi:hypothetical protein
MNTFFIFNLICIEILKKKIRNQFNQAGGLIVGGC